MKLCTKVILYIHGKGGSCLEAYKKNCPDFDMIGIDYDSYLPWIAQNQIKSVYDEASIGHSRISIAR
ncbi:MAG: hypothetical protein HFI93_01575 [Lachnospiraceae bacterium]|nr:hypothetical protein [Lachnospiraceae bacterium]